MGCYENTTYFSDDIDDFLPLDFIRKSSNTIKIITKKIWYCAEKKSNRVEVVTFDAIRFDFDAIRFCFKAFRFRFKAFRFDFGAMSRRFATRRFTQMKQISQIFLVLVFVFVFVNLFSLSIFYSNSGKPK